MTVVQVVEKDRGRKKLPWLSKREKHKSFFNTIYFYPTKYLHLYPGFFLTVCSLSLSCRKRKSLLCFNWKCNMEYFKESFFLNFMNFLFITHGSFWGITVFFGWFYIGWVWNISYSGQLQKKRSKVHQETISICNVRGILRRKLNTMWCKKSLSGQCDSQ